MDCWNSAGNETGSDKNWQQVKRKGGSMENINVEEKKPWNSTRLYENGISNRLCDIGRNRPEYF